MRIATYILLPLLLLVPAAADAQGDYEKTFKSFFLDMDSEVRSLTNEGMEMKIKVKIEKALIELSEDETYYEGTGTITHELYTQDLPPECNITNKILQDGEMFFRIEVEEFFDAAPKVKLYLGIEQQSFPREGFNAQCVTPQGTFPYDFPPQPIWGAGFISARGQDGTVLDQQKGFLIDNLIVEGWEITGIEEEDFRVYKELEYTWSDEQDQTQFWEETTFELKPCLKYETEFAIDYDAFSFSNSTANIWPQSYWSLFGTNYALMDTVFLNLTGNPQGSDFPDWWAFRDVFGDAQIYTDPANGVYNQTALLYWAARKSAFGGACYGFSYSSLLHYCGYIFVFPPPVFAQQISDPVREELIRKFTYQWSAEHSGAIASAYASTTPKKLIEDIVANFKKDGSQNAGLGYIIPGSGHSIVPYKLERCFESENDEIISNIICYDNNTPGAPRTIKVNETRNKVIDGGEFDRGFFLTIESDKASSPLTMAKGSRSARLFSEDKTMVLLSDNGTATISDGKGGSVASGEIDPTGIPGAEALVILNGLTFQHDGYRFPAGQTDQWEISMQPDGGRIHTAVITPDIAARVIGGSQSGANVEFYVSTTEPRIHLGTDQGMYATDILLIDEAPDGQHSVQLMMAQLQSGTSLNAQMTGDGAGVTIENQGPAVDYTLNLMRSGNTFATTGDFNGLRLQPGAKHRLVVGNADSLGTTFIALEIDEGTDGTVDDEIVLRAYPSSTGIDQPVALHADLSAWPSPWNPGQRPLQISYTLKQPVSARLVVYNALQQKVAEIVSPRQHDAGITYRFTWEGRDEAGVLVPSGTYFYVLESVQGPRVMGKVAVIR